MLKKVFSIVLCVVLTMTMLGVSAAVDTQTTANLETGDYTVVTTVDVSPGVDTYTYLAHKSVADLAELTTDDIVYVDEQIATGTTVEFSYTTDKVGLGSLVRVNGNPEGTIPGLAAESTHTVSLDGAPAVAGTIEGLADEDADTYVLVAVEGLTNQKVDAVTVNEVPVAYFVAAGGVYVQASVLQIEEGEDLPAVAVTTGAIQAVDGRTVGLGILENDNEAGYEGKASLIARGRVFGNVSEFGIEFSATEDFATSIKVAAMGKGSNGYYAIKLVDYTNETVGAFTADAPVYARAYYVANDVTEEGAIWAVNLPEVDAE